MAAGDMIFLFRNVSSGTWTVPTGVTAVKVECFGGAVGQIYFSNSGFPQPKNIGGSYSQTSTLSVTAGNTVYFNISDGGSTWVNKTSSAAPSSTADGCLAVGGSTAAASQVAANYGDIKYAGGDGVVQSALGGLTYGRGGQAGPNGAGANAGAAYSATGITSPATSTTYFPGNGGGANGGVSGGLASIPYGRSSGAFGGNGGYWSGAGYVYPTQDVVGQAQYLNGYPLKTPINYGPFGGSTAYISDDGDTDRIDVNGQTAFIVITVIGGTQKSIVFAGSQSGSFTIPSDFGSLVSIRAFGAAGINADAISSSQGGGGGGGGYSETVAASVTASMTAGSTLVYYNVPARSAGSSASSWINIGTNSAPSAVTSGVLAFSGGNTNFNTGGTGGTTTSAVGNTKNAGGTGGAGFTSSRFNGGGGGGSGGPSGAGAVGGAAFNTTSLRGGGGGGGSNGGSAGSAGLTAAGGAGGGITGGTGGTGATASVAATAGTNGGGSGGGFATTNGNPPQGSILSLENGLYYITGGTGGDGGQSGNYTAGGNGGAGVHSTGSLTYGDGLVVFTYVPKYPITVSVVGVSTTGSVGSLTVAGKSSFTPTGVTSTGSVGSITVEAKAQILLTGSASSAVLGSAVAKANAIVSVTGISATSALGTVTTRITELSPIISITGFQATGSVGSLTLIGKANISIVGQGIISSLGIIEVKAKNVYVTTGVLATGNIGNVTITNVVFDFDAVAALYDRNRTVFVTAKSTTKERTALVMEDNRIVYIERKSSFYDRSVLVE